MCSRWLNDRGLRLVRLSLLSSLSFKFNPIVVVGVHGVGIDFLTALGVLSLAKALAGEGVGSSIFWHPVCRFALTFALLSLVGRQDHDVGAIIVVARAIAHLAPVDAFALPKTKG